jgi:hypothetical protein
MELMTPKEVAQCLKISVRTVYDNQNRLGGIYPAGIKVLRFRKDFIDGVVEGQETQGLEVQLSVSGKKLRGWRSSYESGSQKGKGRSKGRDQKKYAHTNPERHGL